MFLPFLLLPKFPIQGLDDFVRAGMGIVRHFQSRYPRTGGFLEVHPNLSQMLLGNVKTAIKQLGKIFGRHDNLESYHL